MIADGDAEEVDAYERVGNTTTLVSAGGNGAYDVGQVTATPDGLTVVFVTKEPLDSVNDTDGDVNGEYEDIYARHAGVTSLITEGSDQPIDNYNPYFSDDGTHFWFEKVEAFDPGDIDGAYDIYERSGGATTLLSPGITQPLAFRTASSDGSRVFFDTAETLFPLLDGDGTRWDAFERSAGTTTMLSVGSSGDFDAFALTASSDGSRVLMLTEDALLPTDDDGNQSDVYQRAGGVTTLNCSRRLRPHTDRRLGASRRICPERGDHRSPRSGAPEVLKDQVEKGERQMQEEGTEAARLSPVSRILVRW